MRQWCLNSENTRFWGKYDCMAGHQFYKSGLYILHYILKTTYLTYFRKIHCTIGQQKYDQSMSNMWLLVCSEAVEIKLVKPVTSHRVILPPTVSVLCWIIQKYWIINFVSISVLFKVSPFHFWAFNCAFLYGSIWTRIQTHDQINNLFFKLTTTTPPYWLFLLC